MRVDTALCVTATILVLSLASAGDGAEPGTSYINPLDVLLADPFVLQDDGSYFLYATSAPDGFHVWSSDDLVNWALRGQAYHPGPKAFGVSDFWAPEVVKRRGRYYLVYSARGRGGSLRLGLASSSEPCGPFRDVVGPWCDMGYAMIDAHVFVDDDDDETPYLYYSRDCSENTISEIYAVRLRDDLRGPVGDARPCIRPSQQWEGVTWNEAPEVMKVGATYVLMYSGNFYGNPAYAVGYATSDTPLGPWTKHAGNPILRRSHDVSGPGHHCVVPSPDGSEVFVAYHTQQNLAGGGARQLAIDRFRAERAEDGSVRLSVDGPTASLQQLPAGARPFATAASDTFDSNSLDRSRWLVFSESPGLWSIGGGGLRIITQPGDIWREKSGLRNLFLQHAPPAPFRVAAHLTFRPRANHEQAFVIVWQDHNNYLRLSTVHADRPSFEAAVEVKGEYRSTVVSDDRPGTVHMRITSRDDVYVCETSYDRRAWSPVGGPIRARFAQVKVGIGATASVSGLTQVVTFWRFDVEKLQVTYP